MPSERKSPSTDKESGPPWRPIPNRASGKAMRSVATKSVPSAKSLSCDGSETTWSNTTSDAKSSSKNIWCWSAPTVLIQPIAAPRTLPYIKGVSAHSGDLCTSRLFPSRMLVSPGLTPMILYRSINSSGRRMCRRFCLPIDLRRFGLQREGDNAAGAGCVDGVEGAHWISRRATPMSRR